MATFKVEINCDDDAFAPEMGGPSAEIGMILRVLASHVENEMTGIEDHEGETWRLVDSNGNRVGSAWIA